MKKSQKLLNEVNTQISTLRKAISYDTRDYPIQYITDKYTAKEYVIPKYQRNKVWSKHQKVRFIESLLLNYPIPLIFLSEQDDGTLEIVDGVQRITTMADFLNNKFKLLSLDKLTKLNSFYFSDLPLSEQRKLDNKPLRIIVLDETTELETRIDLFNRLNTSAEKATPAEIRNGILSQNSFQALIESLAKSKLFQHTVNLSDHALNRKIDIELVSRFFAYSNNYKRFKHNVTDFLTNYIVYVGSEWDDKTSPQKYKKQFNDTFEYANKNFYPNFLKNSKGQTPRVRFEAIMCGLNLALQENHELKVNQEISEKLVNDPSFKRLTTTDGANSQKRLSGRIEFVKNFLLENDQNA